MPKFKSLVMCGGLSERILVVSMAAGKVMALESTGASRCSRQWWVASLRVDQGSSSLSKAKALGPEVFSIASFAVNLAILVCQSG